MRTMDVDLFSEEFWLILRPFIFPSGEVGRNSCHHWTQEAQHLCSGINGFSFEPYGLENIDQRELPVRLSTHYWLQAPGPRGVFIADGTAGQIDKTHSLGFYGYGHEAPSPLRNLYEQGKSLERLTEERWP